MDCNTCKHNKTDDGRAPCCFCEGMNKHSPASDGYSPWTPPFEFTVTSVFDSKSHRVFDMRGWDFLTGGGSLNLPEEEAAKIQDDLGRKIAALMNKDARL